jgi:type IV pilus assembly protein PilY1
MRLLIFGERRGGKRYYALDVTNPDQPVFQYQLTDNLLTLLDWDGTGGADGAAAMLGQSWATPQLKKVRAGNTVKQVFLLAGGYDPNQDAATPAAADTSGRAVYTVEAETGAVFGLNINAGNWKDGSNNPYMTHSIVDVTGFDRGGYGYIDRIYAGDLGGKIIAARYNQCANADCNDDSWTKTVMFDIPDALTVGGTTVNLGQKFMTRPDVALEPGKECVYIGTGDREHPLAQSQVNAIYAVCNTWAAAQPQPLSTANLVDVTDNAIQQGTAAEQATAKAALQGGYGWYIRLTNPGEKVTSAPKLLNKKLYFTTFTQERPAPNVIPCAVPNRGVSRLYAVDYLTGAAVYNFNADGQWTKEDRSTIIGTSMIGDPVLTTTASITSLYYGGDGKFGGMPIETDLLIRRYFWRQLQ